MNCYFRLVIIFSHLSTIFVCVQENFGTTSNQRVLSRHKRIVGGETVEEPNSYSSLATLNIYNSDNSYEDCGASLIHPQWVLTSAHCIDKNPSYVKVILGDLTHKHSNQILKAKTFFIHEDWSKVTFQNDIGLIKLPTSAILNGHVGTIQIASDKSTFKGQIGTILGYGKTESGKEPDKLMHVNVTIMLNEECHVRMLIYYRKKAITRRHICTDGTGGKGFCTGDSGGPLIVGNILVGLASSTHPNCTSGLPSVFTRVSTYSQWINERIFNKSIQNNDSGTTMKTFCYVLLAIIIIIILFGICPILFYRYFKSRKQSNEEIYEMRLMTTNDN